MYGCAKVHNTWSHQATLGPNKRKDKPKYALTLYAAPWELSKVGTYPFFLCTIMPVLLHCLGYLMLWLNYLCSLLPLLLKVPIFALHGLFTPFL